MTFLDKLSNFIYTVEKYIVSIAMGIMFLSLVSGVIFRYALKSPLTWSTELSVFCLAVVTFIGASMTVKQQQSAAVEIVVEKLPIRLRHVILLLGSLIVFSFCIFLIYLSTIWLSSPNLAIKRSPDMNIPMIYPYLIVPIGFTFIAIHTGALFLKQCIAFKRERI